MNVSDAVQRAPQDVYRPVSFENPFLEIRLIDLVEAGSMKPHCLAFGRSLYAFHEGSVVTDATVQRLPLTLSNHQPDAHHSGSNITTLNIPYSFASSQRELRSVLGYISRMNSHIPHLFVPNYGICAVTCRSFTWEDIEITAIHFWPGSIVDGSLAFGQGCFYEHRDPINQIAVGASGIYVLLLVLEGDGYLGLLHFIATPFPHTTFRKLDIGDLSVISCFQIALDDTLGLVFAADNTGAITIISYS
jgi:hypothetical protein